MFLDSLKIWFGTLWGQMEGDVAFAVICGIILIVAQIVNAFFGAKKSIANGEKFNIRLLVYSILDEIWITIVTIGALVLLYMLANLADLTLLPGFEVGDLPTLSILLAFGKMVLDKTINIAENLIEAIESSKRTAKVLQIENEEEED